MPTATYEDLLVETAPARVSDESQYDAIRARFGDLLGRAKRTRAEDTLVDLLGVLIMDYDRRHAMPPDDSTPAEILRFFMEHSQKAPSDLMPVFRQRSHVNEAFNGKRPISAEQARKLGKLFSVNPGLFI
jgi:HTH-type transcriptional regulator/antitoxin HigA